METMQPALKSGRNIWDQINMPVEEFHARVKKIKKRMREEGIDVLLLYGNGFNEYGNYCYISNYVIRLPQGVLVAIPGSGEPCLIFEGSSRGISSVKKLTWIDDIRATGDISKECVKYLKERNLIPSVIGLVGLKRLMPHYQLKFLFDSLSKCKMREIDSLIDELRMKKSSFEILQIQRASRIVSRIFDFIKTSSFGELREEILEASSRREARLEGAEDFRMMIARPMEKEWAFKPPEEKIFYPEEKIIIYISVEFERYWAEAIRTFTIRDSSFEEIQPDEVNTLYDSIVGGMVYGKRISQFYKEALAKIKEANFEFVSDYGLGNGIGLGPKEFPMIDGEGRNVLMQGMCLSLRIGVYNKYLGPVMVGDTFHITKKGLKLLTQ